MNRNYLNLIQDTLRFVKQQKAIPFSECFSIKLEKSKTSIAPISFKPITLKSVEKKIQEPPLPKPAPLAKEKAVPYRHEPAKSEIIEDRFEDVQKVLRSIAPDVQHVSKIPDDKEANAMAQNWKYQSQIAPILIVCSSSDPNEKMFLSNLANALSIYFPHAKMLDANRVEKENSWDHILDPNIVKFIIAPDDQIWDLSNLMKGYKENPAQSVVTLKEIPLFLIPNLKMYFQNPTLKGSLWKALCQKISVLPLSSSTEN